MLKYHLNFIHNSITDRAKKISLEPDIKLGDIQEAIKGYEQSLTSQYGEAIDLLDMALPNYRFYPQEFLSNKLSKIAEHIGENKSEGIIAGLNNQIKDMGDGLNVSQMIDIRKLINKTLRRNARFDYNDIGALKDINSYIDSNIEEALLKNAKLEPKLEVLYDEWKKINAKYRDYKELQENKLYKDIFSENYNNDEKLGNAFINWSKTDERLVDSIIGRLDPRMQDKTQAFILAKSIDKHIQDTLSDGKVVDFLELKKTLSHLENKITNKSLKDYIDILKDMADLFYNDINLMRESGQINILTPNSGSGISHDLIARAHTSTISNIYRTIQRFLPTTAGKNSAFLYHLGKAMNMSRNSKELIFDLVSSPNTPPSLLKELRPAIEAYNGRVGNAIDNAQEIQTQKDQQNYLDMLESSQKYERSLDDTSINSVALERMETSRVSDVGSTGEQTIPHRGDTEGLLPDSGEIRATTRNRDGEFGRVSRSDEGGDRPLRSGSDGGRDEGARTAGKISQESQEIRETNKSTTGTSAGILEAKQTADGAIISQEGLPPSPSLNNLAKSLKNTKDPLEGIADFGTNYPEYYHDGKGAIEKLLKEKHGQVQGAFYKEGLGDIDLVWGEATNAEKHTGYGLAHIIDKHPEITPEKLENIITEGKATIRKNEAVKIEKDGYKVVLKGNWKGEPTENKWIVTAYEKNKEAPSISSDANHIEESLSKTYKENPTIEQLKNQDPLEGIADFGTNYPEYYHDGKGAIEKLLKEKHGQVQGAFYKEGLGDIDLVWGNKSGGLKHIIDKHGLESAKNIDDVINNGKIFRDKRNRLGILKDNQLIGINEKYKGKDKIWVVTSYELEDPKQYLDGAKAYAPEQLGKTNLSRDLHTENPNTEKLKNQDPLEGITDFGTNYPEYYHNGKGAIEKLLKEKHGQVEGAFYRPDIGDITLVWGKEGTGKSDGFGLAKIAKFHPEALDKLDEIVSKGAFLYDEKQRPNIVLDNYIVGIRNDWKGDKTPYWVISSYKKDSIKGIDSNGAIAAKENYSLNNPFPNPNTEKLKNQDPLEGITDFGTNYPEYYHNGKGAIEKLLKEKHGQVEGAFYRPDIGDITLVWGKEGTGKSDGFGLAKIAKFHPEALDKLDELINTLPIVKESPNRYQLENEKYKLAIRKEYEGNKENWVLTAFEKDGSSVSSRTDFRNTHTQATDKTTSVRDAGDSTTQKLKNQDLLEGITDFGTNYPEYYHNGKGAIEKLLKEKHGQVQGAFYKEGLGDIDLVWGEVTNAEKHTGYGLAHIIDKHPDFDITKIPEIIEKGNLSPRHNGYNLESENFIVGINKGFDGKGENTWIVTAFDSKKPTKFSSSRDFTKSESLPSNLSENPTIEQLKNQDPLEGIADFGTNYPEYYHDGKGAIEKLLKEKHGQVQGAFYKEGLGDIDLVWGNEKMGLAHILEKHPEVVDKIPEIINDGEILNKGTTRKFIKNDKYNIVVAENFKGGDKRWLLTAYEDYPSQPMSIDDGFHSRLQHESSQSNPTEIHSTTEKLKNQESKEISNQLSNPLKEAYDRYKSTTSKEYQTTTKAEKSDSIIGVSPEMPIIDANKILENSPLELAYHNNYVKEELKEPFGINFRKSTFSTMKGKEALETLLTYKLGQVRGAFYKEGLGDIDLVWGEVTNAEKHTGYGLAHILDKHPEIVDRIPEIIEKGKIDKGTNRIFLNTDDSRVAIALDYKGKDKKWVITTYDKDYLSSAYPHQEQLTPTTSAHRMRDNLHDDFTTEKSKIQKISLQSLTDKKNQIQQDLQKLETDFDENTYDNVLKTYGIVEDTRLPHSDLLPSNGVASRDVLPSNNLEVYPATEQLKNQDNPLIKRIDKLMTKKELSEDTLQEIFSEAKIPESFDKFRKLRPALEANPGDKKIAKEYYEGMLHAYEAKEYLLKNPYVKDSRKEEALKETQAQIKKAKEGLKALEDGNIIVDKELTPQEVYDKKHKEKELKQQEEKNKARVQNALKKHPITSTKEYQNEKGIEAIIGQLDSKFAISIEEETPQRVLEKIESYKEELLQLQNKTDNFLEGSKEYKRHIYEINETKKLLKSNQKKRDFFETHSISTQSAEYLFSRSFWVKHPLKELDNYVKQKLGEPFGVNFINNLGKPFKGITALETLLTYKLGQVKGAFHKEGLGDIDLVWGNEKMGLAHILEKHPEVVDKIPEIIEKGEVVKNGEFETIVLKNDELYKVGLSKGWNGNGENHWILTAYEDTRLPHSDLLPSNGVASRDVLPSNNLEKRGKDKTFDSIPMNPKETLSETSMPNPTTEQLKNQELLHTAKKLEEKYPKISNLPMRVYQDYNIEKMLDFANPYALLKEKYQTIIKTKKAPNGVKLTKEAIENHKYALNMLSDPEAEKFFKNMNDDVYEIWKLESHINYQENFIKKHQSNPNIKMLEEYLEKDKKAYEEKMKEIYGKYPLEESHQDLIKEAFSDFSSKGTLSEATKTALKKNGNEVLVDEDRILISFAEEKRDKDLEPLGNINTLKAIITPSGYKEFDSLGDIIKEISITPNTISSTEKDGNITTKETLDLITNTSTKQVEVKNPEVNLPITSPSSSSAPSSSTIAKLKDDFKIDPNATISKSPKKRFDNNIEAIKILKKLEENKTLPTLEEKQKLSLYVGWGGLANSFKEGSPEDILLKELLSEEEYIKARSSTLSSYYTPYFVVDSMYKALQNMGFSGGEILEPSVGVGNFFGLLPSSLRHTSNLTGIELDDITAKIAKYLYPSAKIEHTGYENAILSKNNYDLVIGNPPYGGFSVYDKNFKKESKHNIHNYFMLKNLALTKEDGILAQIITTNFLDTKNPEVRELIAKEAEFLGAIRLPQGSFDDTQVATDIVFFRKLKRDETSPSKEWVNLKSIPDSQGKEDIPINSYFVNNPQYMLGIPGRYGGMYGADTVGFRANGNTQVQLQKAIEEITEGIHIDTHPILDGSTIAQKTIDGLQAKPIDDLLHSGYIRPGGIGVDSKSGEIYRLTQDGELEKVPDLDLIDKTQEEFDKLTEVGKKAKLAQIKRIKEMIPAISEIRDTLMHLKRLQLDPMQGDAIISTYRKELNTFYDNFRNKFHTFLNDSKIAKAFDGDPTYPHIAALEEDYKKVDKKYQAKKADIFTKRTQFPYSRATKAKNIEDGIFISYNQNGKLDFETIAELLDKDSEWVKKEMLDKSLAFKDKEGNIIYAPEFLSGNILEKIQSFEGMELDTYQNKALLALKKAIPPKVDIEGIGINMGANYIPIEIYQDFAKEVLGGNEKGVSYQKLTDEFIINFKSSIEADSVFGVVGEYKTISASDVFESALNDKKITMGIKKGDKFYEDSEGQNSLNQQIQAIKEAFKNFIYEDYKRAEKIENVYNDIFNNTKLREFDGSFLTLEGSNDSITLRPHQKNAIYRIISSPATLLDHTVGTGKTYTMVGSVMELRRLGLAKKPLIVVPNHIVNQFGAEFARLYPNANILATRRFDKKSRQRTLSAITTGDWDAIIIGHSNFEMLPMSQQAQMSFLSDQIAMFTQAINAEKIESEGKTLSVKNLQKALKSKEEKLNELLDTKRDETINFEDLGIDALFLDEAHEFKNLEFYTRQNISGVGNQKGSKKAFDLFMKTRYLTKQNKKIVFATGTPISNSIAELYTLQKYLDFKGLKQKGINSFDQWSKTFGKIETRFEYHPSGSFKLTNRFSGYINIPELIKEYKKFSDVIVNEDVEAMLKLQGKEFDLPKADFITVDIKKSPRQEGFMKEIMERSSAIDEGKVEPYEDNYLKVTTDGKKGSLDMRLIDPLYEDNPLSKVNTSITNIIKEYNKWKEDRGTQLVFLDMSTPKNKNPKAKKELDELLKKIEQGDEEAEETLKAKGGIDYIKVVSNDGFSVYEDIRDKLIKEGIPEKEIAFIHDYDTDKKKAELFSKVNDGEVRILLGSTSKMGAGTNVQERIVAIHHLDAPWRPADIEQRNGRAIRQGNSLYEKYGKDKFKVGIYTYVTKGMLDTMIFEKLHTKAKFISQLRKGELSGREIEDIGDEVLNFAEIQAATLEDRKYLEILELKREIDSLEALQKNIANINLRTNREINSLEYVIKHKPKEIQDFKADMESFNKGSNKVQIGNTTYIRGEKDNGLSQALEEIRIDRDIQSIYKYNDFIIEASISKRNADFGYIDLIAHSPNTEESYLISTTKKQDFKANGALIKIDNYFKAPRLIAMQDELKKAQTNLPKLKASLKKFDKQKELEEKTKQHIKLIEELKIKLNSHPYVGLGLFGAISGGQIDYNQDGRNDEADMLLGALGSIVGGRGVKYLLGRNKDVLRNVLKHYFPDKKEEIDAAFKKDIQREKRGIYNVAYNDKLATMIKKDLENVNDVVKLEKGYHTKTKDKGFGTTHIKARHSNPKDGGYVTQQELLDIGNHMREYLKKHKEPFIDKNGARIYEWKNKHGVSFRVVTKPKSVTPERLPPSLISGEKPPLTRETPKAKSRADDIITFYSDRNFKQKMKFRNPNLRDKSITIW